MPDMMNVLARFIVLLVSLALRQRPSPAKGPVYDPASWQGQGAPKEKLGAVLHFAKRGVRRTASIDRTGPPQFGIGLPRRKRMRSPLRDHSLSILLARSRL